jgi:O-acetyl-ADP-ribose deacetylase (regulator of RNase III)
MRGCHTFFGGRISVHEGDITRERVDAIVNAANSSLLGGGGVDGAIHRAGGPAILEACREVRRLRYPNGLPVGEAVVTVAGLLPAKHVIHTVGPVYGNHGGEEPRLLANCYRNAIELAATHALETIAFPAISTGVYGYPADEAASVVWATVNEALRRSSSIREVRLVFYGEDSLQAFLKAGPTG